MFFILKLARSSPGEYVYFAHSTLIDACVGGFDWWFFKAMRCLSASFSTCNKYIWIDLWQRLSYHDDTANGDTPRMPKWIFIVVELRFMLRAIPACNSNPSGGIPIEISACRKTLSFFFFSIFIWSFDSCLRSDPASWLRVQFAQVLKIVHFIASKWFYT